jgi:hypothetical protein
LVEGFGFATFLDANIHFRISSEAKCLIFEGVSYRCTLSRKLSPKTPSAPQVWTDVPSPSHVSSPQYPQAAISSRPTSYGPIASPPDLEPRPSYDSNTSQPEFSHSLPAAFPQTGPFARTNSVPISSGPFVNNVPSYVNMGDAPRPLHGNQPPRGHAVVLVPSSAGFQQQNMVSSGQAFSYNNASLTTVGGYGAHLPLPHGISPFATHGVHYSPGLYSVQLLSYQLPPSMPAPPPHTTGVPFQFTPMPYPPPHATPNSGPLTVVYGSPSPPSSQY